jgi:hypothetical protein
VCSGRSPARPWIGILVALPYVALIANYFVHKNVDFDDNWITYRYARNLAAGSGFVFNPGDPAPTEGFTSLFHVVFTALGLRLGFEPLLFSQISSLLLLGSVPLLALWSLRRCWAGAPLSCLIPFALYLAADVTAWQVGTGMETIFFAYGVFLLALIASAVTLTGSPRLGALLGAAGFVLLLVRPEGGLLFAAHLALLGLRSLRAGWRRSLRSVASAGGTFCLGLAGYLIWKWHSIGSLVPNSYYVKTYGGVFGIPKEAWPGMKHVIQFFASFDYGFPQAAILLLVLLLLRPRVIRTDPARALLVHQLLPTTALLAYYTRIIHESCQFRLEFSILLPMLYSAAVLIASPGAPRQESPDSYPIPALKVAGALVAGFALWTAQPWNWRHLPEMWKEQGAPPRGILFQIGEDLKRAGLGSDLVVLTGAVGATAWVSDASTLDYVGLTDDVLCGRVHRDLPEVERYYRSRNPDVLSIKWPPAEAPRKEEDVAFQRMLQNLSGKYAEGLMVRLYRSEAFLDFVHFVMTDIRDRYDLIAVYGGGPYMIYLLRGSPKADAIRRAFKDSPHVLRGIDPAAYVSMKAAAGEIDPY